MENENYERMLNSIYDTQGSLGSLRIVYSLRAQLGFFFTAVTFKRWVDRISALDFVRVGGRYQWWTWFGGR